MAYGSIIDERLFGEKSMKFSEISKYKYKQLTQKFMINLEKNISLDLAKVDDWLAEAFMVKPEACECLVIKRVDEKQKYIINIVWRILLLRKNLLQALNIPVFYTGDIIDISEKNNHFEVAILTTRVSNIGSSLYMATMNMTMNIILQQMLNDKTIEYTDMIFNNIVENLINPFIKMSGSGKSTMPILKEAYNQKIPFEHLSNGVYQLGWGNNLKIMSRSSTSLDSAIGANLSDNKFASSILIRNSGLPAPEHFLASTYEEVLKEVNDLGFPIVTKPVDQNRGEGVSVDIFDNEMLKKGFDLAYSKSNAKKVIVEKQVAGICSRIFIAGDKMLYAVKRLPKSVIGDGKKTVKELIDEANKNNESLPPWKRTEYFPSDAEALHSIKEAGFTLDAVAKEGDLIPLRRIESTQWGGGTEDVTDTIHPENIDIAIRAAKLFNLYVAGIDIISPDITKPWYENGAIINEVNFSPLYGAGEISKSTIPIFLNNFIKDNGRIPITVVIGNEKAFEKAKDIQKDKIDTKCFISSHDKSLDNKNKEIHFATHSLRKRVKALLGDLRVEELIIVVQTDELLSCELPVDYIDEVVEVSNDLVIFNSNKEKISNKTYKQLMDLLNMVY